MPLTESQQARDHMEFVVGQIENLERAHKAAVEAASHYRTESERLRAEKDEALRKYGLATTTADQFEAEVRGLKITAGNAQTKVDEQAELIAQMAQRLKDAPHVMLGNIHQHARSIYPYLNKIERITDPVPTVHDDQERPEWGDPAYLTSAAHTLMAAAAHIFALAQRYAEHVAETGDNPGDYRPRG